MRRSPLTIALAAAVWLSMLISAPFAYAQAGIAVTSPAPGASVTPGQTITVAIQGTNGFAPVFVFVAAPEILAGPASPALSVPVTIPADAAGALTLQVSGINASGVTEYGSVVVQVTQSAKLTAIAVSPPAIGVAAISTQDDQLAVSGTYSDGTVRDITAGSSGTAYQSSNTAVVVVSAGGLLTAQGVGTATITVSNGGQTARVPVSVTAQPGLYAAMLPSTRSTALGNTVTAFVTLINAGAATATGCVLTPLGALTQNFVFQTTNPQTNQVTGTPNMPANIAAGGFQTFVIAATPGTAFSPSEAAVFAQCTNTTVADIVSGVNTLVLSASSTPVPDVIALAATAQNDGTVHIPGASGTGAFAVATINIGAGATITATADTGGAAVPLTLNLCQTNPANGQCISAIAPSVTTTIGTNGTPTFTILATATGTIPFAPATSRIFVRFEDSGGVTRGSTSVAVETQ